MRKESSNWIAALAATLIGAGWVHAESVSLQDRMQLADGLFRRSFFDLAAKEYETLSQAPDVKQGMDDILFRLAECQRRLKQYTKAEATYLRLIKNFPNSKYNPRARFQCALIQLESEGNAAERAIECLEPLTLRGQPPEVRGAAIYHYAQALEKIGKTTGAISFYGEIRKDYPNSPYAPYANLNIARLLAKTGKENAVQKAMDIYTDLTKDKDPKVAEEALYFAAQLALDKKDYEKSSKLFLELQVKYPNSPHLSASLLAAAFSNYSAGHYKEAIASLDKILAKPSVENLEQILYLKANCHRELNEAEQAVLTYNRLLDEFPNSKIAPDAWYETLLVLYRTGKSEEVLKQITRKVSAPPAYEDQVYWIAAESAMQCKKLDIVVQNCKLLIEKCPKSKLVKDALYRLGWLDNQQKAYESAANWFLKVANQFPKDPLAAKALYSAGICHARMNQREEALHDWTQLLTLYPNAEEVPETLYQKAMEEIRGKDYRAARTTLDERDRRFPKADRKADALYWRAAISRQLKDLGDAEKCYRACLASNPPKEIEREAMLELGVILLEQKREKEAAIMLQQLLDSPVVEKMGPDRIAWLSSFQFHQKQFDAAGKAARILISIQPDKGWLQTGWTLLGRVHRTKGERDPAIHAFREALKTGASTEYEPEASLRLGELLSEAGQFEEAATYLDRAARHASGASQVALRAHAYLALARNAERRGQDEEALRFYISVGILFEDDQLVPEALKKASALLDKLGRPAEAESLREELKNRYPDAK